MNKRHTALATTIVNSDAVPPLRMLGDVPDAVQGEFYLAVVTGAGGSCAANL